ncbi:MAG TPA: TetR/AcrR family transcriptional regulator [Xanthobacteraceae bacterium]|nr:TetR/AcrR family transcriptional regulator [Xanthobacteraceae bacterium]
MTSKPAIPRLKSAAARASRQATSRAAKAASARPKGKAISPAKTPKGARAASSYHHGDLHDALLKAAEAILEREGLPGLTLRAVAREAGVSHAAPAHHFRDLTGLVSELAAIGYRRFGAAMNAAAAPGRSRAEVGLARAHAYLDFARAHPAMYQLMFRAERLDMSNPVLHEAANASFAGLVQAVGEGRGETIANATLTLEQAADAARAWSLMHGFSTLLLDGRLSDILERLPAGSTVDQLLDVMLRTGGTPLGSRVS